jgi:peptidoglycan/LPS O-acetylase OafA/YrhL
MRAFLSWWVACDHALRFANFREDAVPPMIRLILDGECAVDVFIIMSGFVITKLLAEKKEPYVVFITRRLFRLYPVFFVAILAGIVIRPFVSLVMLANWTPILNILHEIHAG